MKPKTVHSGWINHEGFCSVIYSCCETESRDKSDQTNTRQNQHFSASQFLRPEIKDAGDCILHDSELKRNSLNLVNEPTTFSLMIATDMEGLASACAMARRRPRDYRRKVDAATRCSGICPNTWPDLIATESLPALHKSIVKWMKAEEPKIAASHPSVLSHIEVLLIILTIDNETLAAWDGSHLFWIDGRLFCTIRRMEKWSQGESWTGGSGCLF